MNDLLCGKKKTQLARNILIKKLCLPSKETLDGRISKLIWFSSSRSETRMKEINTSSEAYYVRVRHLLLRLTSGISAAIR